MIGTDDVKKIRAYIAQSGVTVLALFTAALAAYMNRVKMSAEKFYIGTAALNRDTDKKKYTAGMFVNNVPVLIETDNSKSFSENLTAVSESATSVLSHQKFHYGKLLETLRAEYSFTEKLYDVIISYQNAVPGETVRSRLYHCGAQTESLEIHIDDRDNEGILRVHFDYQTEKFSEHDIEELYGHVMNLLFSAIADDRKKIRELTILSPAEESRILYEFNDTAAEYPRGKCVHQLFEEQAAKTPDNIAVIACDRTLTYRELNEEANRIAHGLIQKGIKAGDLVAFVLPRKSCLLAVMLGVLKSGAAYLPIDPDYPRDRIDIMVSDSGAKLLITEETAETYSKTACNENPEIPMTGDEGCYCIYTSGSTGKPKGVLLRHRNVVNYSNYNEKNIVHYCVRNNCESIVSVTTCGFDIFVTESLFPLTNGLRIVLANEDQSKLPGSLNELLKKIPADVLQTTPSKMKTLISDETQLDYLKTLKVIILGGEALEAPLLHRIRELTGAQIFNIYGPTETTVWSTVINVTDCAENIPIGRPIANTQIYIVDKYMQIVPIGVTGELCIAGDGVGAGYLHRPELTAEKFIDNPFGEGKLYKTGDLAYWSEDGNIMYVGRNDFQVKVRGLRIELGEIENAVSSVEGIGQTVVIVRKNSEGRQLICAFYTGKETEAKEIRAQIGRHLPKYMLPHIFTHLPVIPLTPSGKVNRRALPEVDLNNISSDTEYMPPKTVLQKALCKLMEAVLGMTPVGVQDDFFSFGGDSLKAIEFVSKARHDGIYFALQNVFDYPTVKLLSEFIESNNLKESAHTEEEFDAINQLLSQNTVLSDAHSEPVPTGNLLLTGATGYLGIHLLAEYWDNDEGTAYCLVRGKDNDDSRSRLEKLLHFYFGDKYDEPMLNRLVVLSADLTQKQFGLNDCDYYDLAGRVNTVINTAASVKYYGSYSYFYATNVESVGRIIDFCRISGAKLIHISTLSVSGYDLGRNIRDENGEKLYSFSESNLFIGQPLDNVYAYSKFEAEKLALEAAVDGLPVSVMRLGNLTNRYLDGVFQRNPENNAFLNQIRAMIELGSYPYDSRNFEFEFTPVDYAVRAVMTLTRFFDPKRTVFHINNIHHIPVSTLEPWLDEIGFPIKAVSNETFSDMLDKAMNNPDTAHIMAAFVNELDTANRLSFDSNIVVNSDATVRRLRSLGFEWPVIDKKYLINYFNYFRKIGYIG